MWTLWPNALAKPTEMPDFSDKSWRWFGGHANSGMEEAIASEWEVAQEAQDEHGGDDGYDDPGEVE